MLVAALALTACAPGGASNTSDQAAGPAQRGGAITALIPDPIDGWDPGLAIQAASWQVLKEVSEPLLRITDDGLGVEAGLASTWVYDAEAMTVTVTLQEGAAFSDGTPVTSEDVRFSAEQWKAGPLYGPTYGTLDSVATPDPNTAVFQLNTPDSSFVPLLAWVTSAIMPKDFGGKTAEEFFAKPIGAGPFEIESESPGEEIVLVRNPHYYAADEVYLDSVTYRVVSDNNQRLVQLQGGAADLIERIPPDLAPQVTGVLTEEASASVSVIGFNAGASPTDSADFRRAVSLAVDRGVLISSIYGGHAKPNNGLLSTLLPGSPGASSDWQKRDVDAAKKALAASGYDGSPVEFLVDSGRGIDLLAAQAIQPMLEEAGITTDIVTVDSGTFLSRLSAGDTEMFIGNYSAGSPTVNDPLGFLLVTGTLFTGFQPESLLPAMGAVSAATTPADAEGAVQEFENEVYDQTYLAPLLSPSVFFGAGSTVHGLAVTPFGAYDLRKIWVQAP